PNSSGYLRSSSHAAAVQYWLRASAAERIVVSSVRFNALSSFFSCELMKSPLRFLRICHAVWQRFVAA
ncbi:hypothetical protein, partial [Enorma massiliensis]|uniref:hypothetical protein n=1 Tax=Enorma massiliensis TaxID=1472761 RepID=UPI003207FAE8